ncbi:hypothetical protein DFH06DRAFT_1330987 [Mycena polygramma]|nr:hypothetical protein DFH06DRAFT_1330987 [Mycena polygramma]
MLFPVFLALATLAVAVPLPLLTRQAQASSLQLCDLNSADFFGGPTNIPDCGRPAVCSGDIITVDSQCNFLGDQLSVTAITAPDGTPAIQICDPNAGNAGALQCSSPVVCSGNACTSGGIALSVSPPGPGRA